MPTYFSPTLYIKKYGITQKSNVLCTRELSKSLGNADHEKHAARAGKGVTSLCISVQQSALKEEQMKSV